MEHVNSVKMGDNEWSKSQTSRLYCNLTYEGCSESNALHFFLRNYLFRMYEIHAQYNWMFPLHVIFPHNLHLSLRPCASVKQGHACLPCISSFPVYVAMSLLHESCCLHLQTLSHTVYPSVAQKDENLTVPDQD
jgi:hypothetical protein